MKMTVSLDVDVFQEVKLDAEQLQVSVPELCSMAIQEFVQNRRKTTITEQLNTVYSTYKAKIDDDILQAQYDLLEEEDW
jgi:hypothetical protein